MRAGIWRFFRGVKTLRLPMRVETFVRGDLDQPSGKSLWITQLGQFREQLRADRLEDLGGIFARESMLQRDRKDQVLIFFQQCNPCFFFSSNTVAYQFVV